MTKLNHEHRDLKEKLREERKQTEELWKTKTQLEDERRLQDRTVEQLQRKVMDESAQLQWETLHLTVITRQNYVFLTPRERPRQKQLILLKLGIKREALLISLSREKLLFSVAGFR